MLEGIAEKQRGGEKTEENEKSNRRKRRNRVESHFLEAAHKATELNKPTNQPTLQVAVNRGEVSSVFIKQKLPPSIIIIKTTPSTTVICF